MQQPDASRFVEEVRRLFAIPYGPLDDPYRLSLTWVGGGVARDGAAIIIFRNRANGPLLSFRYELDSHARLFDAGLSSEQLANIAFSDDLVGPNGHGERLDVDWAEAMVHTPADIEWISARWT